MRPYVVRQGDYLTRIAHMRGFSAEEVWNHPLNDALQKKRASPDVLQPGDILYLPDAGERWNPLPLTTGGENHFTAHIPTVEVKLALESIDRTPVENQPFRVEGIGPNPFESRTDGSGIALFHVPIHIREVGLSLYEAGLYYRVRVGHMDPAVELSGVAKRLAHLGYLVSLDFSEVELSADTLREPIAAFQRAQGLQVTGIIDHKTRDTLVQSHGS
ncbi:peptidoglycan-binding protein [Sorangium sp. So ce296]|uniref:peptidoglycan-binding protein n=1 Tax=Sorangium sp. So ce296 TaxID=3133296 RepID=UPI003F6369AC